MAEIIRCKNNYGEYVEIPREKFFFRPSVYGIIRKEGSVVTMCNKSDGKIWFPGGGIDVGEKMEDALRREVLEETGLHIQVGKLLLFKENFFYYQPFDKAYHAFLFFYLCEPQGELSESHHVQDYESEKPSWTVINEIKKDDISDLEDDLLTVLHSLP